MLSEDCWSIFIASDNFPSSLLTAFVTFSAWKMRPFRALYVMQMWSVLCVKRWNMTPHFCQDRTPRNSWQLLGLTAELHQTDRYISHPLLESTTRSWKRKLREMTHIGAIPTFDHCLSIAGAVGCGNKAFTIANRSFLNVLSSQSWLRSLEEKNKLITKVRTYWMYEKPI